MRNAMILENDLVVTTDNSGGIGEKKEDLVQVPDALTAHYSARVTLLEQWAANSRPFAVLIHNFSGADSWEKYVDGVKELLEEADLHHLPISGSTETNMTLLQSAMSVTMIGIGQAVLEAEGQWFTYGSPLVGQEVLEYPEEVASICKIKAAFKKGWLHRIWPVGSKGILHELRQILKDDQVIVESQLDLCKTAGPSTVVLVYIAQEQVEEAQEFFGESLRAVKLE